MVLGLKHMGKLVTSRKTQVLDKTKVLHGLQTQIYRETRYFKKVHVLNGTKVLHGPRTQTCGETSYFRKIQVLDRTKVLHSLRTQTYGETSYFKKNLSPRQNKGLTWSSDLLPCGN